MSSISSLGLGSGLDAETIVSQLVSLERQPITQLQTQADKIKSKISVYGQIQSSVSSLRDAAKKLADTALWSSTTATSSDPTAVTFSTSTGAALGSYNVGVSTLASAQSVVTNTRLDSAASTVGSGTLTIEVGDWSTGTFEPQADTTAVNINVAATDTLADIRDKINNANAGVSAAIITDSDGARLVMNSTTTGAANGFRVLAADTGDASNVDDAGLSSLAYDPASGTLGTTSPQPGANAEATINGVQVFSSTNTFSNVLSGISFSVAKETDSDVTVNVAQDNSSITKAITEFATAYSSMATLLRNNTKYDESTKTSSTLQGDATAVGLINQFRTALGANSGASSVFGNLSSVGLEMQSNGTLTVNTSKLNTALGNLAEVKKLFANADASDSANDGFGTRLRTLTDDLLGIEGALTTRTAGLNKAVSSNQKRQDELDARAALYEKRLRAQYTALDTAMAGISNQSNYVSQMITAWNKS